jgi:putative SOS response-associated peptidase YedK
MCGRINVFANNLNTKVSNSLGINFHAQQNLDLRPTQQAATLVMHNQEFYQQDASWGIQPTWSKKLLINAQAETVMSKKTFAYAFEQNRCLVPCSGWFEWRDEGNPKKQKYLFSHKADAPLFMAGILYPCDDGMQLVTLTTSPTDVCRPYHSRMPLLIEPRYIHYWFQSEPKQLEHLLINNSNSPINIFAA